MFIDITGLFLYTKCIKNINTVKQLKRAQT